MNVLSVEDIRGEKPVTLLSRHGTPRRVIKCGNSHGADLDTE